MLRADIDQKELMTTSTKPYEMYSVFDALNLIKEIQNYLKDTITDCRQEHLDCALLTKAPYMSQILTKVGTTNTVILSPSIY